MTGSRLEVAVRRARIGDADELAETAIEAWREGFRGIVPERVDPRDAWRPARIADRIAAGDRRDDAILAAVVDGSVRGLVLQGPSRDADALIAEGEIVALYVHPDNWRQGIGRALVEAALGDLERTGHERAIVWTLADSPRNLAFYEAVGFRRDGATQRRPSFGSPLEVRFRIDLSARDESGYR